MEVETHKLKERLGSLSGFVITVAGGLLLYFLLVNVKLEGSYPGYGDVIKDAATNLPHKLAWFFMSFTDAQFYEGVIASLALILGGFIAYMLDRKGSSKAGFPICYGSNMWPWVLASQVLSLFLAIFVLNYISFLGGEVTWIPTFITVVGAPPALMLIYGGNYKNLFTVSILGGVISFPIAFWMMNNIIPVLKVPGVVGNVLTMAITGIILCSICKVLPWMKKVQSKEIKRKHLKYDQSLENMKKPLWFIRRVLADFSEAQFYGNEIAGTFVIIGVIIDFLLNATHPGSGSGLLPAIILSQVIGSAVGVFLYFSKFLNGGWYATYVPVVSVGPACVLMFGGGIWIAIISGVLGGIIGPPLAEYLYNKLPDGYHPTIGNVTSMAITTIIVAVTIGCFV